MVRIDETADDSLAAMRARSKFGIAIAAMIRMIATTISSSISEKPLCFRISKFPLVSSVFNISANIAAISNVCTSLAKAGSYLRSGYPLTKGFVFRTQINFGSNGLCGNLQALANSVQVVDISCHSGISRVFVRECLQG